MHLLEIILAAAVLAAPARADDAASRAEAAYRRVAALPAAEQKAWMERLEARAARAASLTLDTEEARNEQARVRALLHQKTVAQETVVELLVQLDLREKAAISRLVREYRRRLMAQATFPEPSASFLERREAWFRVWSRWEAAGSPAERQDRLIDWLEAAIKASAQSPMDALPADPRFGDVPALPPAPKAPVSEAPVSKAVEPPAAARLEPGPLPIRVPDSSLSAPGPAAAPAVVVPPPKSISRPVEEPGPAAVPRALPAHDLTALLPQTAVEPQAPGQSPRTASGGSSAPAPRAQAPAGDAGRVDVDALAARIAGVNLTLRTLESELEENRQWNPDQLDNALSRLDILVLRQKDLTLFRDLLPPKERGKAGTLDSPRQAITALAARIAEARIHLGGPEAGGDAPQQAAIKRLDALSDRLAALGAEK
jgi:hypothetical protein